MFQLKIEKANDGYSCDYKMFAKSTEELHADIEMMQNSSKFICNIVKASPSISVDYYSKKHHDTDPFSTDDDGDLLP